MGKNEKIMLKDLSENFSEKIYCKREGHGKDLIIKRCRKKFQSLIVMEVTMIRDPFVMCNVNKV